VILPDTASCSFVSSASACFVSGTQLPDQNGVAGVSVGSYETGYFASSSGGPGQHAGINFSINGPLTIDGGGNNCAGIGAPCDITSLLFSWETTVDGFRSGQAGSIVTAFDSIYTFNIGVDGTTLLSGSGSTVAISGGSRPTESITGSASIAIPSELQTKINSLVAGSSGGNVSLTLSINLGYSTNNPTSQYIDFFQPNFSVTAEAPAEAPEPATTGLAMAGLAGICAWLRRKRA
jgi:hypothetical protein